MRPTRSDPQPSARPTPGSAHFEYVLVGGGLQNALIALALLEARPDARVALVERGDRLGGEHTWCFHADDVPREARSFVEPLVEHHWDGYDVRFPGQTRRLASPYAGTSSERLHSVVSGALRAAPHCELMLGTSAVEVGARSVVLDGGVRLSADVVVDSRGPEPEAARGSAGYQKFLGRELELSEPHGLVRPVVMDATVTQRDGFRFFYLLPLGSRRLLVEDTYFSDGPELDRVALRSEVDDYVAGLKLAVRSVLREEVGVLPMPWRTGEPRTRTSGPLRGGYAGGWMHPATGYSFPIAVRLALFVARTPAAELFGPGLAHLVRKQRSQSRFALLLNRLLFHWYLPTDRRDVFERFYRLPESTIHRFYALRMTASDRVRILVGKPPRGLSLRARLSVSERFVEPACH